MKTLYGIFKITKTGTPNGVYLPNGNTQIHITLVTDTLFDTEEEAIKQIEPMPLGMYIVQKVYVPAVN